jgi:hypothetical protein
MSARESSARRQRDILCSKRHLRLTQNYQRSRALVGNIRELAHGERGSFQRGPGQTRRFTLQVRIYQRMQRSRIVRLRRHSRL